MLERSALRGQGESRGHQKRAQNEEITTLKSMFGKVVAQWFPNGTNISKQKKKRPGPSTKQQLKEQEQFFQYL